MVTYRYTGYSAFQPNTTANSITNSDTGSILGKNAMANLAAKVMAPNTANRVIPNRAAYSASKGGINSLSKAIAVDLGKYGIRSNVVLPGTIKTARWEAMGSSAISGKLTYLGKFYSSPAILDECIHMYMAEELTFGETDFDEDEFIEVVRIPLDEMVQMVMRCEIPDVKTQTAVLKAAHILANRKK